MKLHKPFLQFINKIYPTGSIIQLFGIEAPIYPTLGLIGHNGLDLISFYGDTLFAVEGGTVVEVRDKLDGYGLHIKILSGENEWVYGHLSKISVVLGQEVNAGDPVGEMGNSGSVTSNGIYQWGSANPDKKGTHLHLGLRKFKKLIEPSGSYNIQYATGLRGTILNPDNGYKGAINFSFDEETQDITQLQMIVISLANQVIELLQKLLKLRKTQ